MLELPDVSSYVNRIVVFISLIYERCALYSIEKVRQYMQEFFDDAQLLLMADKADQSQIVELCLLCVHCLEVLQCILAYLYARYLLAHVYIKCLIPVWCPSPTN